MRSLGVALFLASLVASCTAPPAPSTPPASPTVAASVTPTGTPAQTAPSTFASVCGTIRDFVNSGAREGSFLLDSPGRAPLKIAIAPGRFDTGQAAGYACVSVLRGVPAPLFDGFVPQGRGFVPSGSFPATTALPEPTGFVVPQACAYAAPPIVGIAQTDWSIDCGATNNNNARGSLGPALAQQGWISCGAALATEQWRKDNLMLTVVESSLAAGDYPRFSQRTRVGSSCS